MPTVGTVTQPNHEASETPFDRSTAFKELVTAGAVVGLAAASQAQSPPTSGRREDTMLLRRATYGARESDLADIATLGYDGWLNRELTATVADDAACESAVQLHYPRTKLGFSQLRILNDDWETSQQLVGATMYRAIHSKRQLYERMVEFWFNHFNVYMYKVSAWQTVDYVNEVIRKHAFGKFPDMLRACARHPAMLNYLDNASSTGGNPNQNYARELMELHTLSSSGGYTQTDVEEVARCFTGWSVEWDSQQPNYAEFEYHAWAHDDGVKHVLGNTIAAGGGVQDGERVLQILSVHPNTARFIAKKMIAWLLGKGNYSTLENLVAQKYIATGGDIKEMLKLILKPNIVLLSTPKFKRPFHLFVGAVRCLGGTITEFGGIRWAYLGQSGHEPYTWAQPNGYPDDTSFWTGLMLPRWNFMLNAMAGGIQELTFDWQALMQSATTPATVVERLNRLFYLGEMPTMERQRLTGFLSAGTIDSNRSRGAIALAMCAPTYQWF